jgi:hypothetical protein
MLIPKRQLSLLSLALAAVAPWGATLAAQPSVVAGRVVRPGGEVVINATVELFETEERTVTDSLGQFRLRTGWTGTAMLVVRAVGDPPVTRELTLTTDSVLTLVLPRGVPRLVALRVAPPGEFQLSSAATSEPLTPLDIVQTPGAAANVARALQVAPGVSNVDEGTGLFVRGGDVTETRVLVDGVVMLSPARFENPTGHVGATLDPFLLSNATLSAGAFGVAYGNALSGIVRLETAGRPTRSTGSLTASVGGASASGAFAITPRLGLRVQADVNDLGPLIAVFGEAQPYDPPPRGGEAALTLEYAPSAHGRLRLFTTRQRQQFGVGSADVTGAASYAATSTEGLTVLSWRDTARTWRPSLSIGRSTFTRDETLPGFDLVTDLAVQHVVATLTRAPGTRLGVTLGVEHERFTANYRGADRASGTSFFDVDAPTVRTGGHAELAWRVTPTSQLTTGVRIDRSDFMRRTTVDPRVSFATQRGAWGVVASVGAYHQVPEPILVRDSIASPMRVVQGTLAVERGDSNGARLRIEAYARRWRDLSQFTPDFGVAAGGTGDAIGVDSELRFALGDVSRMRLVWSVLDARRTDPRSGVLAPAPSSITHSVTWITERTIGRLSINSALRYATGRPFTDIVGRTATATGFAPVFGAPNAERLPGYWRSDVSVSWLFARRSGPTAVFWAALSNVFDRRNVMRYTWNAEFTERTPVRSPFNRSVYAGATLLLP